MIAGWLPSEVIVGVGSGLIVAVAWLLVQQVRIRERLARLEQHAEDRKQ